MNNLPMPMIVFFTCAECKSCLDFRGIDGIPSDDKQLNSGLIRNLLSNKKDKKLNCSKIINIHDGVFGPKVDNIYEFVIYFLIPSNIIINDNFFNDIMNDENNIYGDSILRIAVNRNLVSNFIDIFVSIDGNENDRRCLKIKELVELFFIWNMIPKEFDDLRLFFRQKTNLTIENIITNELRNDSFFNILSEKYFDFMNNPFLYENEIRNRFDYDWFLAIFFPSRIRELEIFYPSWILMVPSEWGKGIGGNSRVYGKVRMCKSILSEEKFITKKINNETMEDLITQYYAGRLKLIYEELLQTNFDNKKKVSFNLE